MPIPNDFWRQLRTHLTPEQLKRDAANCLTYSYDNGRHRALPSGVVLAETQRQVQRVIELCHHYSVPVTARGRGTGTPGGAVPTPQGLVLSLERMNRVLDFNPANRSIEVEAGVLNQTVQTITAEKQLFWPPDPSSAAFCTVGGNIAYNAGGPRAVKYGTTRDNVLAIKAITGTGEFLQTGFSTAKVACGYDLGRLLIGSEGTLAIIVAATLKLTPIQPAKATLQVWFRSSNAVATIIPALLQCPAIPCALEFMDSACLNLLRAHSDLMIPSDAKALLMIEVDGLKSSMPEAIQLISAICHSSKACLSIDSASDTTAREQLWIARKALSPTLRQLAPHKINEDIVVPIDQLTTLFNELQQLATRYAFTMVNFGHIGSGNLHVNVLLEHLTPAIAEQVERYLSELFGIVLRLGGCLSGEHGIGLDKKPYLTEALSRETRALMKAIKAQFDPHGILNPDKLLS